MASPSTSVAAATIATGDSTANIIAPRCVELAKGTMLINVPPTKASIEAQPQASSDAGPQVSSDARIAGESQVPTGGNNAQGVPVEEGTHLVEAVDAAYED